MLNLNPNDIVVKPILATIHCEPGWKWKKWGQAMPNYDLFYVWSGEGTLRLNDKIYPLQKHCCLLFRPGDVISASHTPQNPLVITYIHFDTVGPVTLIPQSYRVIQDPIVFETLLRRYVRLFLRESFAVDIEARLILMQLMVSLLRDDRGCEQLVSKESYCLQETIEEIANYVQQHPADPHSIESLAARANLSPKYFSQKFREIVGVTVRSFIVQSRIKRAEHMLHHAGLTVTEAAYELGYNDIHFFSRQFKQYTGKNPSQVR